MLHEGNGSRARMDVSTIAGCVIAHHRRDDVHLRPRRGRRRAHLEDHFSQKKGRWLRLHEKNGNVHEMPCHHKLEEYLDSYINGRGHRA